MRGWKNILFPLLACLAVAALALLPARLSALRDGELYDAVRLEELGEDANFPAKPPEMPVRVRLLGRYEEGGDLLTVVGAAVEEDAREWLEANTLAREEAELLMEEGIVPQGCLSLLPESFLVSKLFLRDPADLSSASYLVVSGYDWNEGTTLSLTLDAESGKTLALRLYHPDVREYGWASPEDMGGAFLDRLGLSWEILDSTAQTAVFRVPESGAVYYVLLGQDGLEILPRLDWAEEEVDAGDALAAYGYPTDDSQRKLTNVRK